MAQPPSLRPLFRSLGFSWLPHNLGFEMFGETTIGTMSFKSSSRYGEPTNKLPGFCLEDKTAVSPKMVADCSWHLARIFLVLFFRVVDSALNQSQTPETSI